MRLLLMAAFAVCVNYRDCAAAPLQQQSVGIKSELPKSVPLTIGKTFRIRSESTGQAHEVNVWVPPQSKDEEQQEKRRSPVLYVIDGGADQDFLHIAGLAQLATMAQYPDSLIERKCGRDLAVEASERAGRVLRTWETSRGEYGSALKQFDTWLRADGNRRNPGTTADMLAAALFVYIRDHA